MIYVLRHAESRGNIDSKAYLKYKNSDIPLTHKGERQAEDAGELIEKAMIRRHVPGFPIFHSPYDRCKNTANIIAKKLEIRSIPNLLLSEIACGEQEGCNVEYFSERPIEDMYWKRNHMHYKPIRGESFLEVHVRAGLFVVQQGFFQFYPHVVIVSHAAVCLMLHYFLTQQVPSPNLNMVNALEYWPNALIRQYNADGHTIKYEGILQGESSVRDVLLPPNAQS